MRAAVLARDGYLCQRCPDPHPLTTTNPRLPTHATLGHRDGTDYHLTQTISWNPEDYQAECARSNYSDGATKGNQLRSVPTTSSVGASRRW